MQACKHMELTKELQGKIRGAISNITPSELDKIFEFLRYNNYQKIRSATNDEERLIVQLRTRIFDELELSLKSLRNSA